MHELSKAFYEESPSCLLQPLKSDIRTGKLYELFDKYATDLTLSKEISNKLRVLPFDSMEDAFVIANEAYKKCKTKSLESFQTDFKSALIGEERTNNLKNPEMALECVSNVRKMETRRLIDIYKYQNIIRISSQIPLGEFNYKSSDPIRPLAQMIFKEYVEYKPSKLTTPDKNAIQLSTDVSNERFAQDILLASGLIEHMVACFQKLCKSDQLPMTDLKVEVWQDEVNKVCGRNTPGNDPNAFIECFSEKADTKLARTVRDMNIQILMETLAQKCLIAYDKLRPLLSEPLHSLFDVQLLANKVLEAHESLPLDKIRDQIVDISEFTVFWQQCYDEVCGDGKNFYFKSSAGWKEQIMACAIYYYSAHPRHHLTKFDECFAKKVNDASAKERRTKKLEMTFEIGPVKFDLENDIEDIANKVHTYSFRLCDHRSRNFGTITGESSPLKKPPSRSNPRVFVPHICTDFLETPSTSKIQSAPTTAVPISPASESAIESPLRSSRSGHLLRVPGKLTRRRSFSPTRSPRSSDRTSPYTRQHSPSGQDLLKVTKR